MAKQVTRHIKSEVERELWRGVVARCQFSECNRMPYKSSVSQPQKTDNRIKPRRTFSAAQATFCD